MKKVLIIAYYWGTRIPALAKYLPEFGWEPIILTAPMGGNLDSRARIIETPCPSFWDRLFRLAPDANISSQVKECLNATAKKPLVDFIFTCGGAILNYPDSERCWKPFAVRAGSVLLQKEDIDVILSSSSPVTCHLVAKELKARYKIPWVADFRDLWSQNHNYSYGQIRKLIDKRLELKTLFSADALVTTSEPWSEKLRWLHNPWANKLSKLPEGKKVYTITHGFDPAEVNAPATELTDKFTITYTGTINTRTHDPSKLFIALQNLILNGFVNPDDIEVRFYGRKNIWLGKEAERCGLSGVVTQYGLVPRDVVVGKQRESQVLLRFKCEKKQVRGAYSIKIFEYLGARRPILATGGSDDVVSELLNETKAGVCTTTVEDIMREIKKLYQEYKLKGEIAYKGVESKLNKYTQQVMARKFAEVLNSNER